MQKLYYVRYLESSPPNGLLLSSSPVMVVRWHFDKGCVIARNTGRKRKKDALAHIEEVNRAAGKVIAVYAGAFVPPTTMDGYELPEAA